MPSVAIKIGGRSYEVACRAGDEPHLRALAEIVDGKAADAARSVGGMSEARQLLFAALLLADEVEDARAALAAPPPPAPLPPQPAEPDPALAGTLERLADRIEALAARLETEPPST